MTGIAELKKAFNAIANFMYEPMIKDGEEVNSLAYAQRRVLNGLCYSTSLTLSSSKEQLDQAAEKVRLAARSHRGDEISEQQLQRAIDWADRLQLQVTTLEAVLDFAAAAHLEHTGEKFVAPVARKRADSSFQSKALDAAKRYGANAEAERNGGVEVAADEGVM